MQSKLHSLIESIVNILIGYTVAIISQLIIFPFFDINIPLRDNLLIGMYFTLISLVRSYVVRRVFNHRAKGAFIAQQKYKEARAWHRLGQEISKQARARQGQAD